MAGSTQKRVVRPNPGFAGSYPQARTTPVRFALLPVFTGLMLMALLVCALPAYGRKLERFEQMSLEAAKELREVERYQIRVAEKYYLKGDWEIAAAEYEKFLTLYERSSGAPYAQLMWSRCTVNLRHINTAIKDGYQSVIDYWPDSPEAISAAYLIAKSYKDIGEIKPAKKAYAKVIETHSDHLVAIMSKWDMMALAKIEKDEDRRTELLEEFAYKIKRTRYTNGYCSSAARELANRHFYADEYDDAIKALATTYKEGPDLNYRIYDMARRPIHHLTGQDAKKVAGGKMADKIISLLKVEIPNDLKEKGNADKAKTLWYRIADVQGHARRDDEVLKTYERMAKLFGDADDILEKMANWYKGHKQRDKTRSIYGRLKNRIRGQSLIAYMWREDGKWDNAIAIYQGLMKEDNKNADGWQWEIAECYKYSKRYKEAINTYRQCDRFPSNYQNMAWCHRRIKQHKEAMVLYNQIMGGHPQSASWALLEIARTFEESGNKGNAIKMYQQVCKRFPKSGQASQAHAHLQLKYKINVTLGGAKDE
jgi:TolA-binding protein